LSQSSNHGDNVKFVVRRGLFFVRPGWFVSLSAANFRIKTIRIRMNAVLRTSVGTTSEARCINAFQHAE